MRVIYIFIQEIQVTITQRVHQRQQYVYTNIHFPTYLQMMFTLSMINLNSLKNLRYQRPVYNRFTRN